MKKRIVAMLFILALISSKGQEIKEVGYMPRVFQETFHINHRPVARELFFEQLDLTGNTQLFNQGVKYRKASFVMIVPVVAGFLVSSALYEEQNEAYLYFGGATALCLGSAFLLEHIGEQKIAKALSNHNDKITLSLSPAKLRLSYSF